MVAVIAVENLVKRYRDSDRNAVDGISFTVAEGEFFAFLGPNGAGKTTTTAILTTVLAKTAGRVTIAGHDLDRNEGLVRRQIGVIFQNPSLDQNLTGEENLRVHAAIYGLYPFRFSFASMPLTYKEQVAELAALAGLQKEIFQSTKSYSGGMKRKLEIIRSLLHRPKILFLDEPTAGLDPVSRKNFWEYLERVRTAEKITIFLTTHYLDEAEDADRVCIINRGKILLNAAPAEVKKQFAKHKDASLEDAYIEILNLHEEA